MTEAERWLVIAERFDAAERNGDGEFDAGPMPWGGYWVYGLCHALGWELSERVDNRLTLLSPDDPDGFWWPIDTIQGRNERVLAACFLAAMAEEDG